MKIRNIYICIQFKSYNKSRLYFQLLSYDQQIIVDNQINCPLNCQQCQDSTSCDQCLDHYYKIEDFCEPFCEAGCQYCNFPHFCTLCQKGYYLKEEGKCYENPIQQQPQVLLEYETDDRIWQVQTVNENEKVFFSYRNNLHIKVLQGEQEVKSFSITEKTIEFYRYRPMFYQDENIIFIYYFENDVQVQRYDINSNLISQEKLDLSQFSDIQINYDALMLVPIQGQQYILTFYQEIFNPNLIQHEIFIQYAKLDLSLQKVGNVQIIFNSEQRTPFNIIKGQDSFQFWNLFGQTYIIKQDKIEELFCYNKRESNTAPCTFPLLENWNTIQLTYQMSINYWFDDTMYFIAQYYIIDGQRDIIIQNTNVLSKGLNRQTVVKVFKYINSFVIIIEELSNTLFYETRYLVAQYIYNTGKKIGEEIYICSLPQNFMEIVQYQNGFKMLLQNQECNDQICTNNLVQMVFDRENDLPDPDEAQKVMNDPANDGRGIEIQEKCNQQTIKELIKFSNNDYAIVYICENILRMRKFNQDGLEIKFVEITLDLIHLFDVTLLNDQIYFIMVYVSDKTISKVYKLDDNTNTLVLSIQIDINCKQYLPKIFEQYYNRNRIVFQTFWIQFNEYKIKIYIYCIKIENLQMKYLIFITFQKNYVFDNVSLIGRSQSLIAYDIKNYKVFEKLDVNNPSIFTIDDCDKNIIKAIKVLGDSIYLVQENKSYFDYKCQFRDDYGAFLYSTATNIPNISKIKLEMSKSLVAFMYQLDGTNDWVLNLCGQLDNCIFNSQQSYLWGVQDFSIAVFQYTFVISYSEKLNQKLYYKMINNNRQTIFSETIQIDSQLSRPILVTFSNQYIGFAWEFKNNEEQWGLQLSIINNTGKLVKSIINVCSSNCNECTSNTECIV